MTVVILRQNMRQKTQSPEDAKLRQALENMRYAACTEDDNEYLKSITVNVAHKIPHEFKNVSVISPKNCQRDAFNELMQDAFAKETKQTLHEFYAVDTWGQLDDPGKTARKQRGKGSNRKQKEMSETMQNILWKIRPGCTKSIPGILKLCIGIPVMLKFNQATELCMTNGQQGHVAGWTSTKNEKGQEVLEVVFVKLHKPASDIQIPGLEKNVVPVTRKDFKIKVKCPASAKTVLGPGGSKVT
ncbi:hypothetical protein BT96DRAFT_825964 [Gymnopus androsaceus JB14]|uniref:Uncharacterized protein n=1 Tax=Gymnopus androsaceus JB14 TaxID=1447944 RepID=A0A6A4HBJ3_9AGAR|nr:hypothetical protein BT96DRAFT_825964 [Gymnopus androsaceus JB14]